MLGANVTKVGWPYSGEIDAMESNNQMVTVLGTVHAPDYAKQAVYSYAGTTSPAGGVTGWHTFGVSKTASGHHLVRGRSTGVLHAATSPI